MDQKTLKTLRAKLEQEKKRIEGDIKEIAGKNGNGQWEVKVPDFGDRDASFEKEMDQEEEYDKNIQLEKVLEPQLVDIQAALRKMEQGTYGICEKCGTPIDLERLEVNPEARTHTHCASGT